MMPMAMPGRPEPRVHISWDKDGGPKLAGDLGGLAPDKDVTLTIRGKVTGYSMGEYGCSIDLKPESLKVGGEEAAPKPENFSDMVMKKKGRPKKDAY